MKLFQDIRVRKAFVTAVITLTTNISAFAENKQQKKISEAQSERVGELVIRYFRTFSDPCLTVQALKPGNHWIILSSKTFCSFEGQSFLSNITDAGFENIRISTEGVHATVSITPLKSWNNEIRDCLIPINGSEIGKLSCAAPKLRTY